MEARKKETSPTARTARRSSREARTAGGAARNAFRPGPAGSAFFIARARAVAARGGGPAGGAGTLGRCGWRGARSGRRLAAGTEGCSGRSVSLGRPGQRCRCAADARRCDSARGGCGSAAPRRTGSGACDRFGSPAPRPRTRRLRPARQGETSAKKSGSRTLPLCCLKNQMRIKRSRWAWAGRPSYRHLYPGQRGTARRCASA